MGKQFLAKDWGRNEGCLKTRRESQFAEDFHVAKLLNTSINVENGMHEEDGQIFLIHETVRGGGRGQFFDYHMKKWGRGWGKILKIIKRGLHFY